MSFMCDDVKNFEIKIIPSILSYRIVKVSTTLMAIFGSVFMLVRPNIKRTKSLAYIGQWFNTWS